MSNVFKLGPYELGRRGNTLSIAEVGLAHDGSLGAAHAYIDAAADCGAAAIKFQTHIAQEESTPREEFRVKVFPQDATRYDYWQRTSFEKSQWLELAAHARQRDLLFLSSPFSNLAVEWLMECDVAAWKIASGEVTNFPMLRAICSTQKPVLLSSGMSGWDELDAAVALLREEDTHFGVFQCTTAYPCPPEAWGLNILDEITRRYACPAGLSDHSGSIVPSLAAVAMGAAMLEFHIAFSKSQFGPDAKASLTLEQTAELIDGVRLLDRALCNPVDKDLQSDKFAEMRQLFSKSIVSARALSAGEAIQIDDLAFKKPGIGISAQHVDDVLGRVLTRDVPADHFFAEQDFQKA